MSKILYEINENTEDIICMGLNAWITNKERVNERTDKGIKDELIHLCLYQHRCIERGSKGIMTKSCSKSWSCESICSHILSFLDLSEVDGKEILEHKICEPIVVFKLETSDLMDFLHLFNNDFRIWEDCKMSNSQGMCYMQRVNKCKVFCLVYRLVSNQKIMLDDN